MFRLIGALLVGILSASLAVIYQNDIAAFLGRAPITVQIIAGPWYPIPQALAGDKSFSDADRDHISSFASSKDSNFARLTISNNTGKDISHAYIKVRGDSDPELWKYYAVAIKDRGSTKERDILPDARETIDIGDLPAAQDTVVYLWSNRGFSWPYNASDIEILTTDGTATPSTTKVEATSGELFLGISTETIAWTFVFLLIALFALLLFALNHGFSFAKAMLKDEDYYLSERVRYEGSPEKYSVPEKLPKS
jgi:hypothetical protein